MTTFSSHTKEGNNKTKPYMPPNPKCEPEIVWGVVGGNNGAALCVYDTGSKSVLFASKSERFSRTRHDSDLNLHMQEWALNEFGQPNTIVFHERKWLKQLRRIYAHQSLPFKSNKASLHPRVKKVNTITYSHTLSHVANGFHTSGFSSALVVCVDTVGEFDTASVWLCDHHSKKCLHRVLYPNSAGLFFSGMVRAAGMTPGEDEVCLMAASAPNYGGRVLTRVDFDLLPEVIRTTTWPMFHSPWNWHMSNPPQLANHYLTFHDFAATGQSLLTRYVKELVNTAKMRYGALTNNLVLTGNVFNNAVLNSAIARGSHFSRVHIPVDPSDSGSAIGAAMMYARAHHVVSPFTGFPQAEVDSGVVTAELLNQGVIGVIGGKAELNDRSLGNRSLLAFPTADIKKRINQMKGRDSFLPFGCVVRDVDVDRFFHRLPGTDTTQMQYSLQSREKEKDQLRPVLHIDDTAIVQTVHKDSYLHSVLTNLEMAGKYPVLINTSFNRRGEPMVNSKDQAINFENLIPT
jgi:carbamoyltransferase